MHCHYHTLKAVSISMPSLLVKKFHQIYKKITLNIADIAKNLIPLFYRR